MTDELNPKEPNEEPEEPVKKRRPRKKPMDNTDEIMAKWRKLMNDAENMSKKASDFPAKSNDRDRFGMPLREKFGKEEMGLTDAANKTLDLCIDELRKYIESAAVARAVHFGAREVTLEDIMCGYAALSHGMTLQKLSELINNRMMGMNFWG